MTTAHWHGLSDFLAMGGHGLYVWGAYGAAALLLVGEAVAAHARWREALRRASEITDDDTHATGPTPWP